MSEEKKVVNAVVKQEKLEDIIAYLRSIPVTDPISTICAPIVHALADRIEAAWKRDAAIHAMTCEANERLREHLEIALENDKRTSVGNAAAMREAFNKIGNACAWIAENCNDQQTAKYMNDVIAIVQSAIAMPPRQCDVGTAEEQNDRFLDFCSLNHDTGCYDCDGNPLCPVANESDCKLAWAQMPYEAKEGGSK